MSIRVYRLSKDKARGLLTKEQYEKIKKTLIHNNSIEITFKYSKTNEVFTFDYLGQKQDLISRPSAMDLRDLELKILAEEL